MVMTMRSASAEAAVRSASTLCRSSCHRNAPQLTASFDQARTAKRSVVKNAIMPHPEFSERPGMLQLQGQMRKKEKHKWKGPDLQLCLPQKKEKTGS